MTKFGTWNVYRDNEDGIPGIKTGITAMIKLGAEAFGLQELSNDAWWLTISKWMVGQGWWFSKSNNAVPLAVNAKVFTIGANGNVVVSRDPVKVEPGAGGDKTGYKSFQYAEAVRKSNGERVLFINHHIIPSLEVGGRVGPDVRPLRWQFALRQINAVGKFVQPYIEDGWRVLVSSDWNISSSTDAGATLRKEMARWHLVSAQDSGEVLNTHGNREIDDIYGVNGRFTRLARVGDGEEKGYGKNGSDHSALVATFDPKASAPKGRNPRR